MSKRKDPASAVVEFFESASIETADTVLSICKGIVARRGGRSASPRKRATSTRPRAVDASADQAEREA